METEHIDHTHWNFVRVVGQGSFGSVHLAKNMTNDKFFVVKRVWLGDKISLNRKISQYKAEVEILQTLNHKHIVSYLGHMANMESHELLLYLEYVGGGSLREMMKYLGRGLKLDTCRRYLKQILDGLVYLHDNDVVHRDLKPANVLITLQGDLKLADFGTAKDLSAITHTYSQTIVGTPAFVAPEVCAKSKHTTASDIWSLGCMAFEMAAAQLPFEMHSDLKEILGQRARGEDVILWPSGVHVEPVLRAFVMICVVVDPKRRQSARTLMRHPLFADKMLEQGDINDYLAKRIEKAESRLLTEAL